MSRITKDIATDVAIQLTANKKAEIKKLEDELAGFITGIYEASLSDLIKQAFKKHKGFLHTTNSIRLTGAGLSVGYKYYALSYELPKCNSCGQFPMNDEQSAKIVKLDDKIQDLIKEHRDLKQSIENALYNLRTYANVEREFPEAFKLLPVKSVNTALMVNIKDIRCKLDGANC